MNKSVIGALAGLWVASGSTAYAEEQGSMAATVVELYTSQGCSSCPPADEYLRSLAAQPGVIALALHVDYWDYIGWADKFGNPKFTARQKAYAHAGGSNTIYTPQMIVGGMERIEGTDPEKVEEAIRDRQGMAASVSLHLVRRGAQVAIAAQTSEALQAPLRVQLVRYHPMARVKIEQGENAGRVLDYANVVTAWTSLGMWDGQSPLNLTAPVEGEDPVVVILQADGPGRIFAAALLK